MAGRICRERQQVSAHKKTDFVPKVPLFKVGKCRNTKMLLLGTFLCVCSIEKHNLFHLKCQYPVLDHSAHMKDRSNVYLLLALIQLVLSLEKKKIGRFESQKLNKDIVFVATLHRLKELKTGPDTQK